MATKDKELADKDEEIAHKDGQLIALTDHVVHLERRLLEKGETVASTLPKALKDAVEERSAALEQSMKDAQALQADLIEQTKETEHMKSIMDTLAMERAKETAVFVSLQRSTGGTVKSRPRKHSASCRA